MQAGHALDGLHEPGVPDQRDRQRLLDASVDPVTKLSGCCYHLPVLPRQVANVA
jgi:hypothetical protein